MYTRPVLRDLSQGARIDFVRQFRLMSQDLVSDMLGITGENKRRTMTRYEKGNKNPKEERTKIIASILNVNYNLIKRYDYKNKTDIIYTLMWLEELIPNYKIDLSDIPYIKDRNLLFYEKHINKWLSMRNKRDKREITYKEYIEWKLSYEVREDD
jgi:transcriptional regulator with XRE-family HTH domain